VLAVTLASACAHFRNNFGSGAGGWNDALGAAQADASRGQFDSADSLLAGFANRNPGTNEALETTYWRALFKLDPSNRSASVQQAMVWLDGYLTDPRTHQHMLEATTLRRVAGQLDALNKLAANASAQAQTANNVAASAKGAATEAKAAEANASATADARDAEIKKLKDDLAKANAELDRIRKRLSQPPR
jgi:hypothetical protein